MEYELHDMACITAELNAVDYCDPIKSMSYAFLAIIQIAVYVTYDMCASHLDCSQEIFSFLQKCRSHPRHTPEAQLSHLVYIVGCNRVLTTAIACIDGRGMYATAFNAWM